MSANNYRGYANDDHYGQMYASGAWGTGKLDAAGLAAKYGLDRSNKDAPNNTDVDAGHIWGRDAAGKPVYIGQSTMELGSNAELIKNHSTQLYADETVHNNDGSSLDNFGDIQGAILTEWNGGAAAPEKKPPVVLSDRAAEAIAGTKAYENVFLPRQGDYAIKNDQSVISDFKNDYALNLQRAKAPQPQEPQVLKNAEAEASGATQFANDYKKSVADTLRPQNNFTL